MRIVVSLTSYPKRYSTLHICLKSLFNQTLMPDLIVLYIYKNDIPLPQTVLDFKALGLVIEKVDNDIKPHKKYFYAMQEFSSDILITVDDDCIYPSNLVKELIKSYNRFPNAVSTGRAHGIRLHNDGSLYPYTNWYWEICSYNLPSFRLMATGVGGVLYPPDCLVSETFNISSITKYCLNQDDVWLKCMELLSGIPVTLIYQCSQHPIGIPGVYNDGLYIENKLNGGTDSALKKVLEKYSIDIGRIINQYEQI